MKFLELNKKRHAIKTFNDKSVDYNDLRTAIEIATLAPSANNIQPWKFVVVQEKKDELAKGLPLANKLQVEQAQYVIALFSDTDLALRSRKIARIGVKSLPDDLIGYYMETLPPRFASFNEVQTGEYLAINAGIVAMNLVLALTDQKIASNIILGFDKSTTNEILDIDPRFRPELLITVGYSDEKPEPSYRLPVDEVIERR
ncbi:nitroreductase family protein [Streptococcus dysgalactiae subsp. equisimilis]|mgnify:FL=1|uniref:NAD(P)H-dependent quinone reductase n=3 Tax=Streptococcus dysgalactiae TaxID=1334 RepID=A0A9X8T2N6_STREQ|nr:MULTISPECIES: nitroreductase family protein [Streptococcus]ADX24723.1 NADH dehydrogenase [Streptococcus dysgalactiae subsp. equisimilis ATCC 12394]EGL49498.1 nitroreductase family protein [Streptococcus dysgalactiae subsp. equisimilis SK1249]EGR88249.1 nitroreductase family protein [Streptococcus dysgalactiae subsp. equisimilis SK1250]BAN93638.1 NAD(P)H-dependent quinone reductase [Streptococcus dysgalactiae subsp. equisimilis 167]KKC19996.1 nitroreductase [Streptococcus dysgalactiae subsp.